MNAPAKVEKILNADVVLLKPGMPFAGGFYVGQINVNGALHLLIASPKDQGDIRGAWNDSENNVEGALSYFDGQANTAAMIAAGSKLAKQVAGLEINGFSDWYIPSQDELELMYRNLKPTSVENWMYARSGINLSAVPPTYPYTATLPAQCEVAEFQLGAEQAFERAWYWSSTQRADNTVYAWVQGFGDGYQLYDRKSKHGRARAVRRLIIQ